MKRLLTGSTFLIVGELLSRLALLAFTAFVARILGLDVLAELSVAQTVLAYATVAGDAGLTAHAVRRLSTGQDRATVIQQTTSAQLLLAVLGLCVCVPVAGLASSWTTAALLALVPIAVSAAPTYLLQSESRMGVLALSRVVSALITSAAGLAVLVTTESNVALGAYSLGALATSLMVVLCSRFDTRAFFRLITWRVKRRWLRESGWLIVQSVVVHAYASTPLLLGSILLEQQGFVELATSLRIQLLLLVPANILQTVLLPLFIGRKLRLRVVAPAVFLMSSLAPVFTSVGGGAVLSVAFGSEAALARHDLVLLSLQVPFAYVSTVLLSYLIAHGYYARTTVAYVGALSAQLMFGLIVGFQAPSLFALSLLVSEVFFVAVLLIDVRQHAKMPTHDKGLLER